MASYPNTSPPPKGQIDHRRRALLHHIADALLDQLEPAELARKLRAAGFTEAEIEDSVKRLGAGLVL